MLAVSKTSRRDVLSVDVEKGAVFVAEGRLEKQITFSHDTHCLSSKHVNVR